MVVERNGVEIDRCLIFDVPEEKGVEIIIPVAECMRASLFMTDEEAQKLINIIQNKINARL